MLVTPTLIHVPERLVGERVVVRPYEENDAPQIWEAVEESREHLAPWVDWVHEYRSPEDARAFVIRAYARWLLRENLMVGVFEKETNRYLGGSGLHRINWELRTFEIGYWLRASAQGKGYITEAVKLLTQMAFEDLKANRVEIRMDTRNVRSYNVAKRLGFMFEGTLRRCSRGTDGQITDKHVFSMIPEEYHKSPVFHPNRKG